MTSHFIVAPAIHLGNTRGFLDSISDEIRAERIILIDNTDDDSIGIEFGGCVYAVLRQGRNSGVAHSWNAGVRIALVAGAEMVTICSTSLRFNDGAEGLCRTADLATENGQFPYGFESMNGWRCITFNKRTLVDVGPFDERFSPAYFEDNDYIWRMRCAGILEPAGGDRSLRKVPWVGALKYDVVEDAHAIKNCDIVVDFVSLREYYSSKWGGPPGEEQFTIPFDEESKVQSV